MTEKIYRWQMANKHMKGRSKSHVIREVQIKITMSIMAKIQNTDKSKYWQMGSNRNSHSLLVEMRNGTAIWDSLAVSYRTNHVLTIWLHSLVFNQKTESCVHTKSDPWMFIAALFITAKTRKQARSPSVGEWINKLWNV